MNAPHVLLKPDLGHKAYRLRCKFTIGAAPSRDFLDKAKYAAAEKFVQDMAKQGWVHVSRFGFHMTGPFPAMRAKQVSRRLRVPSAKDMLPAVLQGATFRAPEMYGVQTVPVLGESEDWDYELASVFVHKTILVEHPDRHEEMLA